MCLTLPLSHWKGVTLDRLAQPGADPKTSRSYVAKGRQRHLAKPSMRAGIGVLSLGTKRPNMLQKFSEVANTTTKSPSLLTANPPRQSKATGQVRAEEEGAFLGPEDLEG